jgi:urease accessory protein UreF
MTEFEIGVSYRKDSRYFLAVAANKLITFKQGKLVEVSPYSKYDVVRSISVDELCARWNIDSLSSTQAYAWAWVENQVLAAVKLVPLGQSAGQRMLHALNARLGALCTRAVDFTDSDIGVSTTMQAVASGRHETQYTRLFRS